MFVLTKYGPYVCVGVTVVVILAMWFFFGGQEYEFVGYTCPVDLEKKIVDESCTTPIPAETKDVSPDSVSPPVDSTPVLPSKFTTSSTNKKFVSKGEKLCCEVMQQVYGLPFASARPDWLINSETGRALELDCYNEELQIAVEYNGEQHYKWPNFTNQSYEQFIDQVRRDQYKTKMCQEHNVYLITVPYNVRHNKIHEYIISHLPETIQSRLTQ